MEHRPASTSFSISLSLDLVRLIEAEVDEANVGRIYHRVTRGDVIRRILRAHFREEDQKATQQRLRVKDGVVTRFLEECCVLDPNASSRLDDLYLVLKAFCYKHGAALPSRWQLSSALRAMGLYKRTNVQRYYTIRLKDGDEPSPVAETGKEEASDESV